MTEKQINDRIAGIVFMHIGSIWLLLMCIAWGFTDARDKILDAVKPQPPVYRIEIHGNEVDVPRDARVLLEHWQRGEEGYKVVEVQP